MMCSSLGCSDTFVACLDIAIFLEFSKREGASPTGRDAVRLGALLRLAPGPAGDTPKESDMVDSGKFTSFRSGAEAVSTFWSQKEVANSVVQPAYPLDKLVIFE